MEKTSTQQGSVLFIPHGGGPMPLLGDKSHQDLVTFLKSSQTLIKKPKAILMISAHWEENVATITSNATPELIYDYYGFPKQAYQIEYPAAGDPELAHKVLNLLKAQDIETKLDPQRGFDHGMYVPLKLIYPEADIPCVQLSLLKNLDAQQHINIGKALNALLDENILIVGSGFSFHNMEEFRAPTASDSKNEAFEAWMANFPHWNSIDDIPADTAFLVVKHHVYNKNAKLFIEIDNPVCTEQEIEPGNTNPYKMWHGKWIFARNINGDVFPLSENTGQFAAAIYSPDITTTDGAMYVINKVLGPFLN